MIKFALICENAHLFESWFQNGDAYDAQAKSGLVLCPQCETASVTKAIMAPAIATRGTRAPSVPKTPPPCDAPAGVALLDDKDRELRAMIEGLRQKIFEVAEDVGAKFPEEARKIHDGLIPERPIHGQASIEEARDLIEDGIKILPIPLLPDEHN
jgi:hypothetical protein